MDKHLKHQGGFLPSIVFKSMFLFSFLVTKPQSIRVL